MTITTLQRDVVRQHSSRNSARTASMRPPSARPASPLASLKQLQRKAGNVAIARLLRMPLIQAKLTVGPAGDAYEREADAVAGQVMRMAEPIDSTLQRAPLTIQRLCPECEEEAAQRKPIVALRSTPAQINRACAACEQELQRATEEEPKKLEDMMEGQVQAKHDPGDTPTNTAEVESYLGSSRSGGQPLSDSARSFFEPRFGYDFGNVRVHADHGASQAASSIQARAFTVGSDIVFGANQYEPGSETGRTLLAHELTHVVQQGAARDVAD